MFDVSEPDPQQRYRLGFAGSPVNEDAGVIHQRAVSVQLDRRGADDHQSGLQTITQHLAMNTRKTTSA